jgi:hypothetical protein
MIRNQSFQVARLHLLTGHYLFERRKPQDCAGKRGKGAMAEENLLVEDQVLQFAPLDRHDRLAATATAIADEIHLTVWWPIRQSLNAISASNRTFFQAVIAAFMHDWHNAKDNEATRLRNSRLIAATASPAGELH